MLWFLLTLSQDLKLIFIGSPLEFRQASFCLFNVSVSVLLHFVPFLIHLPSVLFKIEVAVTPD